jgi:hypothetical protein
VRYRGVFDHAAVVRAAAVARAAITACEVPVSMVVDMSDAEYGDQEAFEAVVEATRANTPYIRRTAVIDRKHGAKRFLAEAVLQLTGRSNVCVVESLEEAEVFVRSP